MKKFIAVLFSILLCALISMLVIRPVQAYSWPATPLPELTWLPPYIQKVSGVVVYRHNSTVKLAVPVTNDVHSKGLNVSKVIIEFDWGQNQTLDLSADIKQVGYGETEFFTVSFRADATEAVSSHFERAYKIYVEYVNATTGPTRIVGTYWAEWDDFAGIDYKFVVFSTDQADAFDLYDKYDSYNKKYPSTYFTSANASQLRYQALVEADLGEMHYNREEYDLAKTRYQTAVNLFSQAVGAQKEWMMKWEEAELNANMTVANALLRQADASVNQSYAWILFGLGFVFMGISTIVYAWKKPKAAQQA